MNQSQRRRQGGAEPTSELYLRLLKGEITPEEYVKGVNREVRQERQDRQG